MEIAELARGPLREYFIILFEQQGENTPTEFMNGGWGSVVEVKELS